MKNLFFIMMAILLINVSYAEVGEDMGSNCSDQVQSTRYGGDDSVVETDSETRSDDVRSEDTTAR